MPVACPGHKKLRRLPIALCHQPGLTCQTLVRSRASVPDSYITMPFNHPSHQACLECGLECNMPSFPMACSIYTFRTFVHSSIPKHSLGYSLQHWQSRITHCSCGIHTHHHSKEQPWSWFQTWLSARPCAEPTTRIFRREQPPVCHPPCLQVPGPIALAFHVICNLRTAFDSNGRFLLVVPLRAIADPPSLDRALTPQTEHCT